MKLKYIFKGDLFPELTLDQIYYSDLTMDSVYSYYINGQFYSKVLFEILQ